MLYTGAEGHAGTRDRVLLNDAGIAFTPLRPAGTEPGVRVHPEVVSVMSEIGIDLSSQKPQILTDELAAGAAMLVTMGCGDACPVVPGAERDDWPLSDPKGQPLDTVRAIRDEIRERVARLVAEQRWK